MKTRIIAVAATLALAAVSSPAFAQFAGSGGTASSGGSNISGAGTGLSAPPAIGGGGSGLSNPNAIAQPSTPAPAAAPVQPIYPGVGSGGAGLPPAAVLPQTARGTTHTALPGSTPR